MSHDLTLAQNHAFQLAQTLMVPVTLFRSDGAFGVLPSAELDDGEVETIADSTPSRAGRLVEPAFLLPGGPLASCGGKGSSRRYRALATFALRGVRKPLREVWRRKTGKERRTRARAGRAMERSELEELRGRVPCAAVLEKAGFAIDLPESTRKAVKYRRGDAIVIVIHAGRGWFDPRSDAKGDVFGLVGHLDGASFVEGLDRVAALVGFVPKHPAWPRLPRDSRPVRSILERWSSRRTPWSSSMTWGYLRDERSLPEDLLRSANRQNILREGPHGSMWAAHRDETGAITGWEERGPEWRGFSTGGAKLLFRFGPPEAPRLCMTEAAIDAMSLAALEHARPDSLYLSTGGGWSPATAAAIRALAARAGALLVAATDNNGQGETYAHRLMAIAIEIGCGFERLRPIRVDWNAELQAATANGQEEMERRGGKTRCRMPAGRVKGGFARVPRPLTRPDGEAAAGEGSEGLKVMARPRR